uniref:DEAD/DEAH box helicase domain protein n=1 Tax=Geobacter sp. (strain M21) TaxID=443144 RepID=C6E4Y2_GEOSM
MKSISDVVETAVERSLKGFAFQIAAIEDSPVGLDKSEALRIIRWIEVRFSQKPGEDVKNEILFLAQHLLEGYKQNPELNGIPNYVGTVFRRLGNVPALTMIPSCYNSESQQFESSGSIFSDISTIKTLLSNTIRVANAEYTLTADQFNIWNTLNNSTRCCGISAPTSAGKSFVISLYVASVCSRKKINVVYLVPTNTLIDQVSKDLKALIRLHNIVGYNVKTHISEDISLESQSVIFVMTQERFAVGQSYLKKNRISIEIVIVDEVQNIEKVEEESDDRSHVLYEVIRNLYDDFAPSKFVLSGPRIGNIKEINEFLFFEQAASFTTSSSPVVSLSYSFKLDGLKLFLRAHTSFLAKHIQIEINNKYVPYNVFGSTTYDTDAYSVIDRIVNSLESNSGVLIFSPTKKQAESTSSNISDRRPPSHSNETIES